MLAVPLTVLNIRYPSVVYAVGPSHSIKRTVPSVVYVNSPPHSFKHNISSSSSLCHSFKHDVSISSLC